MTRRLTNLDGAAQAGDAMARTIAEGDTLAGIIDARLLDAGDATGLIAGTSGRPIAA